MGADGGVFFWLLVRGWVGFVAAFSVEVSVGCWLCGNGPALAVRLWGRRSFRAVREVFGVRLQRSLRPVAAAAGVCVRFGWLLRADAFGGSWAWTNGRGPVL